MNIQNMSADKLLEARNMIDKKLREMEMKDKLKLKYNSEHGCYLDNRSGKKFDIVKETELFSSSGYINLWLLKRDGIFYIFLSTNSNFDGSKDIYRQIMQTDDISKALDFFSNNEDRLPQLNYETN